MTIFYKPLDIGINKQKGPTTRFNDAICTKTKVITNNKNIKKYPLFSNNILIIHNLSIKIPQNFIETSYEDNNIIPMTVQSWCEKILSN